MQINPAPGPGSVAAPAIAVGLIAAFAIQQAIETVDSVVTALLDNDTNPAAAGKKKAILKVVSLALGVLAATAMKIDILAGTTAVPPEWHWLITAIALAGGTDGVNSVLKYLGYAKENKKSEAASSLASVNPALARAVGRK